MKFLTWCNDLKYLSNILLCSAERVGIELRPVGMGREYKGAISKIDWLFDEIIKMPADQMICCVDCSDVFFQKDAQTIEETFLSFNKPIVYGAERWYSHQDYAFLMYYDTRGVLTPYRYLNAGIVFGYVGAIRKMFDELNEQRKIEPQQDNDQWFIGRYAAQNSELVALDNDCKLTWNLAGEWGMTDFFSEIKDGFICNLMTKTSPCLFHVPWTEKHRRDYELLAKKIGLP